MVERFANNAFSPIVSAISATATAVTVTSENIFPYLEVFRLLLEDEIVIVTDVNSDVFTIARGQEGTIAANHEAGTIAYQVLTAGALDTIRDLPADADHVGDLFVGTDRINFALLSYGATAINDTIVGGGEDYYNLMTMILGGPSDETVSDNAFDLYPATLEQFFVTIDLGQERYINHYRVIQGAEWEEYANYDLKYSFNGIDWVTVGSHNDATPDTGIITLGSPITARYWQLRATVFPTSTYWEITRLYLYDILDNIVAKPFHAGEEGSRLTVVNGQPVWSLSPKIDDIIIQGANNRDLSFTTKPPRLVYSTTSDEYSYVYCGSPQDCPGADVTIISASASTWAIYYGFREYGGTLYSQLLYPGQMIRQVSNGLVWQEILIQDIPTIINATGDLIVGTGADTAAHLALTVPAANILNVLGVVNGETTPTWKPIHDATPPSNQAFGDSGLAGTALTASHRDHRHAMPAAPKTVATDLVWDAAGDLVVGTGWHTAEKLTKGANGTMFGVVAGVVGWVSALAANFVDGAAFRLANAQWIRSRNANNTADVDVVRVNASNQVEIGITWTDWTPTIDQDGDVVVDVEEAKYALVGKICHVYARLCVTGAAGGNIDYISIGGQSNAMLAACNGVVALGTMIVHDVSGSFHTGVLIADTSTMWTGIITNRIGYNPYFNLAVGDKISCQATYRVA